MIGLANSIAKENGPSSRWSTRSRRRPRSRGSAPSRRSPRWRSCSPRTSRAGSPARRTTSTAGPPRTDRRRTDRRRTDRRRTDRRRTDRRRTDRQSAVKPGFHRALARSIPGSIWLAGCAAGAAVGALGEPGRGGTYGAPFGQIKEWSRTVSGVRSVAAAGVGPAFFLGEQGLDDLVGADRGGVGGGADLVADRSSGGGLDRLQQRLVLGHGAVVDLAQPGGHRLVAGRVVARPAPDDQRAGGVDRGEGADEHPLVDALVGADDVHLVHVQGG